VLERVDLMNDEVANRMLKTLEEPPPFVHLILLTSALGRVLETVVSRCQLVRFDPLSADRLTDELLGHGIERDRAAACARLALGSGERARYLASAEGEALRSEVEALVRHTLAGEEAAADEPWRALLARAEGRRETAEETAAEQRADRLELEPKGRERRALERELEESAKREGRRARTSVLDLALELAALSFRDLVCIAEGADEAVLARDRLPTLAAEARSRDPRRLRTAAERCEEAREALELNVSEDLALQALTFRLRRLVGSGS